MLALVIIVIVLLIIGLSACWMLDTRSGPFSPYTATSIALGIDPALPSAASALAALTSPTTSAGAGGASSTSAAGTSQSAAVVPVPKVVNYISATGADMPGSDMSVVGDDGTQQTSRGVYGPSGCTAACTSNSGCVASVYQPSTKTCWIKSAFNGASVTADSDKILSLPMTSQQGTEMLSTSFIGPDIIAPVMPTLSDCETLCQMIPSCAGVVYDNTYGKACHIKSTMSSQANNSNTNAWVKAAQH